MQETGVQLLGWEDLPEKEMAPTPVFLPGKSQDKGAWRATVPRVPKSQTQLSINEANIFIIFYK